MTQYHVGTSPITNTIYAGRLDKTGQCWASKSDVTGAACGAVAEHVIANGGSVVVSSKGVPKYEITMRDLTKPEEITPEGGSYERQFREMVQLWAPVDSYARAHPKMKLGESVAAFVLNRLVQLDSETPHQGGLQELVYLIKRLTYRLDLVAPGHPLVTLVKDYLTRHGLEGKPTQQELDSRPRVIPATPQAFDDLAYQILALALNNGTREAFPGKLKKLLEEVANNAQA